MNNEVVEYDDLIEDQVAATEALLEEEGDIDQPCKGCGTPVSTPKELLPITVFCTYQCFALKG